MYFAAALLSALAFFAGRRAAYGGFAVVAE